MYDSTRKSAARVFEKGAKAAVDRCTTLTYQQKEFKKQQIDNATVGADFIVETARDLGIDLDQLFGIR
jgi:hypothetical protein